MAGMGALEFYPVIDYADTEEEEEGGEELWPERCASSFGIMYCVTPSRDCFCRGSDVGGKVRPCPNGGKFKKGEMMIWYGDGPETFCHVTCVSHDLADGYLLKDVDDGYEDAGKDGDEPRYYLRGMEDLEPSHAEWATAYLKAMRYGDVAKTTSLRESMPMPRSEQKTKKRAAAGAAAPASSAKKPALQH